MNIQFAGANVAVIAAVERTNVLLKDPDFFDRIRDHPRFDMSTALPSQIADQMERSEIVVSVILYKSKWPWSKALAFEDDRYPRTVFLNERRLNRSLGSICATIVHECVHALDSMVEDQRFGHGDNDPNGKENTAPYWIGDLAEEMVDGQPSAHVQLMADMSTEWG